MFIMTKAFRYISAALAALLSFTACSGTIDSEVPEGVLRIFADRTGIPADGNEEVTFTVMFGSRDVSMEKTTQIFRTLDGKKSPMSFGANKFTTTSPGTYTFTAEYYYNGKHVTDNEVEVVAEPFFTGEEKNYRRRFLGTLFTSTSCTSCPTSSAGLKELQEEMPGLVSIAAFHSHFQGNDPMTIPETEDFKAAVQDPGGYPNFNWNMRKEAYVGGSATSAMYAESLEKEKKRYDTYSGVAINTVYDKKTRKLDIEVGITSNLPSIFRYVVILVEDDIPAEGDYAQDSQQVLKGYRHNNVARKALTDPRGDRINKNLPLNVGVEVKAKNSVTLEDGWNAENMRVIVAAMTSGDSGTTWTANNVNECKVGGSAPYMYEE